MRGLPEQRVTWHLDNWAYWYRDQTSDFGRGYLGRDSSGAKCYSSMDFDSSVDTVYRFQADAVQAIIDGMVPVQRCAIYHKHQAAAYRFQRYNPERAYKDACIFLSFALVNRGIE